MVKTAQPGIANSLALLALVLLALATVPAPAAVVASIDRGDIELNESFTLKVTVDTAVDTEPDAESLNDDFYVLSRSQLSNTTIVNGQISRSRTWSFSLMAKQAGELTIPPVTVGNERSQPLKITVAPQHVAVPGEADVFVTAEIDYPETFVQAQVLYRIKVYRAVATRQPRLSEPELSGVDALVEIAADESSYESLINGKTYNVVERAFAIFPQESGDITIAPARFEARVLEQGRITGRKIFQSEAISVKVKPIPPPPEEFPDAAWLPARSVELSEEWSREPDRLPAGEPVTRHVTISALGQLSTQIPAIEPVQSDALKVYPDKPELSVSADPAGILAVRHDQYALIGTRQGDIQLPRLELPWWDIDAGTWRVATLPARKLRILPGADELPTPVVPEERFRAPAESPAPLVVHSNFWRHVSEAIAIVWLLTLLAWWRTRRPHRTTDRPPERPAPHKQEARLLKAARRAATNGDMAETKRTLLEWGKLNWSETSPRSIGELSERVGEPLATELRTLSRVNYGPDSGSWDGAALARALRSSPVPRRAAAPKQDDLLPPLLPRP